MVGLCGAVRPPGRGPHRPVPVYPPFFPMRRPCVSAEGGFFCPARPARVRPPARRVPSAARLCPAPAPGLPGLLPPALSGLPPGPARLACIRPRLPALLPRPALCPPGSASARAGFAPPAWRQARVGLRLPRPGNALPFLSFCCISAVGRKRRADGGCATIRPSFCVLLRTGGAFAPPLFLRRMG